MSIYQKDWRKKRIASFDVETTGLDNKSHRICQFGCVIFEKGKPVDKYCTFINTEGKKMDKSATRVCGITDDMLVDAKPFKELAIKIKKLLKSVDIWVAYNDHFDRGFILKEFKKAGIKIKEKPCIDPLIWSNYLWSGRQTQLPDLVQNMRITDELKQACRRLNINQKTHQADYDSLMCGMSLFELQNIMPKTLRQTLYVQDFLYRSWFATVQNKKFLRDPSPTMPPEHRG